MRTYTGEQLSTIIDALVTTNGPDALIERLLMDYRETRARELPSGPITKWDALHTHERAQLERTPFMDGVQLCSGCGTPLPTEAAFAQHFTVTDRRYLNLGSCGAATRTDGAA